MLEQSLGKEELQLEAQLPLRRVLWPLYVALKTHNKGAQAAPCGAARGIHA